MMRRGYLWLCVGLVSVTAARALTASQDFSIVNRTGFEIESIFVSEAGAGRWGNNVLGILPLGINGEAHVAFARTEQSCLWDVMVEYRDQNTAVWPQVDVCSIRRMALFWDRATRQTVARAE